MSAVARAIDGSLRATEIIVSYVYSPFPVNRDIPVRPFDILEQTVYEVFKRIVLKGLAVIFLDIDGVLFGDKFIADRVIDEKIAELSLDKKIVNIKYRDQVAMSALFAKSAVHNLNTVLESMKDQVAIVLSTQWRLDKTLLDAREVFKLHDFASLIIDMTAENLNSYDQYRIAEERASIFMKSYDVVAWDIDTSIEENEWSCLRNNFFHRSDKIIAWLEEHPMVTNFAILDDLQLDQFGTIFGKHYIKVNPHKLFSSKNARSAISALQSKV